MVKVAVMKSWRVGQDRIFTGAPPTLPHPSKKYGLAHKASHIPKQNGNYCTHNLENAKSVDRAFTLNKSNFCLAYFLLIGG